MLPRKLILENIGPFIYETIDFTDFLDQGLFLITGKTGAGKSTILDALSFALFGEAVGNSRQAKELRSNFADDSSLCQVTFEFTHHTQCYRITRSPQQQLAKKRGAGFREHKAQALLQVFTLSGEEVDTISGSANVNRFLHDLLQLNRQQFTQIMLLPQGEFRKFLLADSEEKTKLLRTLFATLDYQRLTDWFKEQLAKRRKEVDRQFDQLNTLQSQFQWESTLEFLPENLADDQVSFITQATKSLDQLERQITTKQTQLQESKAQLLTCQQAIEQGQLLNHQQAEYQNLLVEQAKFQSQQDFYEQLKAQIADLQWFKEQISFWQQLSEDLTNLKQTSQQLTQTQSELDQAQEDWQVFQKAQVQNQELAKQIEELQVQLGQIAQLLPLATSHEQKLQDLQIMQTQIKNQQQQLQNEQQQLAQIQVHLQEKEQQQRELSKQMELQASWQLPDGLTYQLEQALSQLEEAVQSYQRQQTENEKLQKAEEQLKAEQLVFMQRYADCQKENIDLLKERLQANLQPGEPCPICGSTEHPALNHQDKSQKQATSHEKLLESETKLQVLNQQREALLVKETRLTEQLTQIKQQLQATFQTFGQNWTQYQTLHQQILASFSKLQATFPAAIKSSYHELQQQVTQLLALPVLEVSTFNQQATFMITSSQNSYEAFQQLVAVIDQTKNQTQQSIQLTTSQLAEWKEQQSQLIEQLQVSQQGYQDQKLQSEKLTGEITSLQQQLSQQSLTDLKQKHIQMTEQLQALQRQIQENQAKEQRLRQQLIRNQEALHLYQNQKVQQTKQLQTKLPVFEQTLQQLATSQLIEIIQTAFSQCQPVQLVAQLQAHFTQVFHDELNDSVLKTLVEQVAELLHCQSIIQQLPSLQETYQQALTRQAHIEERLVELYPFSQQASVDLEQLKIKAQNLQQEIDEFQQVLATMKLIHQQNQKVLTTYQEVFTANQEALAQTSAFAQLTDTLTGKNQQNLSLERYILQMYFNEILKVANQRLFQLTKGRYMLLIDQSKGSYIRATGLELLIYDAHSGENRRVQTLSGGESFIVALSLALSLADVIQQQSGGIQIEALFIDEGFGTLDEEALAQALQALMQIESEGRLIGIISHVRELKEQIYQQLQVKAKGNGQSTLHVKSLNQP